MPWVASPRSHVFLLLVLSILVPSTSASRWPLHQDSKRSLASHSSWFPDSASQQYSRTDSTTKLAPTCVGYLIGIGTQKGGTTAAWAYMKHKAHPMLRVSDEKEIGFWDKLHSWYKGCSLGDYQMLVNGSSDDPAAAGLPICPIPAANGQMWAYSSNRLKSSSDCGIKQKLQKKAAAAAPQDASTSKPSTAPTAATYTSSRRCSKQAVVSPPRPWWWFWGHWPNSSSSICLPITDEHTLSSNSSSSSTTSLLDVASVAANPMYEVDITPSYLYAPTAPLWLKSMLPEARILIILREPVSRAISNFNMKWQKIRGAEAKSGNDSFSKLTEEQREAAWRAELSANATHQIQQLTSCYQQSGSIQLHQPEFAACIGVEQPYSPSYDAGLWSDAMIWQGVYADGLERWFDLFPAKQIMVWISEDFKLDPASHMRQLVAWIGLEPSLIHPKFLPGAQQIKPVHVRDYEAQPSADAVQQMQSFYAPHNERLFRLLEAKGFAEVAQRMRVIWGQAAAAAVGEGSLDGHLEQTAAVATPDVQVQQ